VRLGGLVELDPLHAGQPARSASIDGNPSSKIDHNACVAGAHAGNAVSAAAN
jgi:hypothetical protein